MPDLSLVAILAITIATIFVVYYGIKMTNRRADEAMAGVQRGLPISLSTRWLILFTHAVELTRFGGHIPVFGRRSPHASQTS